MSTSALRWFVLLVLPLLARVVVAAEPDPQEIARLVLELGDKEFNRREAASKRLVEIGEAAGAALRQAEMSPDAEIRRRATEALDAIEQQLYGEKVRCIGHKEVVLNVCVFPDGKRLLTGSGDSTLRLWDAGTGKELQQFEGPGYINSAALSADGRQALAGHASGSIQLWDLETGKLLQQLKNGKNVTAVTFGPEGKAISDAGASLRLWDLKKGEEAGTLDTQNQTIYEIAFHARTGLVAFSSLNGAIRVLQMETGKLVHTFQCNNICFYLAFSPDGKRLATADGDGLLRIWNLADGKQTKQIQAHKGSARCVAFSPDGKRLVSGGFNDNSVCVWDVETGKQLHRYTGHTNNVLSVAYFPDGKRIASGSSDFTVRIWPAPK